MEQQIDNELWKVKLKVILKEIIRVCDENNITYFLTGGSCLGAVRHKDIIPWDDDIDIIIPRADYDRFLQIAPSALGENFELGHYSTSKGYFYQFMKVYDKTTTLIEQRNPFYVGGLFVDVFPLDGTYNNKFKDNLVWFVLRSIHHLVEPFSDLAYAKHANSLSYRLAKFVKRILSPMRNTMYEFGENVLRGIPYSESKILRMYYSMWGKKESGRACLFAEPKKEQFGDMIVNIPVGYDEYLTNMYKDYMTPPPVEKRVTHHDVFYANLDRRINEDEILALKKKAESY